jgi:MFS transporter, MHS family, proline/betaine transporter
MSSTVSKPAPKPIQVAAAVIGNALEWYDFVIFGFLTVVISKLFFPADDEYASLLLTTATFGAGFLMRPLGGILLGLYADRVGRKAALQFIIGLMTVATAIITVAPAFAVIGVAAPLMILIARLLQGLAAGGEWGCSTAFLIETASARQRGFYGSWQMAGQGLALLAGALVSFFSDAHLCAGNIRGLGLENSVLCRSHDRTGRALYPPVSRRNQRFS